ncbi:hypothetical protein MEY_00383 [Candida albicans 19F]|nr:hypothetical protein MEY_00383 [Candida albicans 19F]KHC62010.1 hypothetical protein MGC_00384 [Candida albicans P37039]
MCAVLGKYGQNDIGRLVTQVLICRIRREREKCLSACCRLKQKCDFSMLPILIYSSSFLPYAFFHTCELLTIGYIKLLCWLERCSV